MLSRIALGVCCGLTLLGLGVGRVQAECGTPDLAVSALIAPPAAVLGQPLQVAWTVTNLSPDPTEAAWSDTVYLSQDAALSPDDTLLGGWPHVGALGMGESYQQETWLRLASLGTALTPTSDNATTVYLILVANAESTMTELGYTNNRAAVPILIGRRQHDWSPHQPVLSLAFAIGALD